MVPSYAFGTDSTVDSIFLEAFERIQIPGSVLDVIKIDSAFRSANSLLIEWLGRFEVDFTRKRKTFNLVPGQSTYALSPNTFNVIDVLSTTVMSVTKNEGGAPFGDPTHWIEGLDRVFALRRLTEMNVYMDVPGQYIGWRFSKPSLVSYICVWPWLGEGLPWVTASLRVEYLSGGLGEHRVYVPLQTTSLQPFLEQPLTWIYLEQPVLSMEYRIVLEKGLLNIAGLFFGVGSYSNPTTTTINSYVGSADRVLGAISFSDWMNTASKNTLGTTSSYVFDAGIPPKMILYPVPGLNTPVLSNDNSLATNIMYTSNCFPEDVVDLVQTFNIPKAFIEALICGLANRLAQKFKPELMQITQAAAEAALANAFKSNFSNYPLTIEPKRGWA